MAYCREKDIARFAELREFPIIPCNLCGSQENLQREMVKEMLNDWDHRFPGRIENMFRALQNVAPSHLADPQLYDFSGRDGGQATDAEPARAAPGTDYGQVEVLNL